MAGQWEHLHGKRDGVAGRATIFGQRVGAVQGRARAGPGITPVVSEVETIPEPSVRAGAGVAKIGPELLVQLARSDQKLPFKEGDQILIKRWDENRTVFYWQTNVAKISGQGYLTFSSPGTGMTVQQRKSHRVSAAIPLSFAIIAAADAQLNGEKVPEVMSQNISVGGLFFEQGLLLTVGDKLEIQFHLPSSEPVHAVGWVVRCEPISVDERSLHSVAVEFLQIDEMDQFRLLEFGPTTRTQPLKRKSKAN